MKEQLMKEILLKMSDCLDQEQRERLERVMITTLHDYVVMTDGSKEVAIYDYSSEALLQKFIAIRRLDGLQESTLCQYEYENRKMLEYLGRNPKDISTDDIRYYLAMCRVSKTTLNNKIRYINAFFKWLEEEEIIMRNPMNRIHSVKLDKVIKKPYLDTELEDLRNNVKNDRDRAIMEVLYSTGVRVSELCRMNKTDIVNDECIVFGKGAKERKVYFSKKSIYYLKKYMSGRADNNEALFVSRKKPYNRLSTVAIESIMRKLGSECGIEKVHPHRFRRTLATNVLNRGMPLQEVKEMLGHEKLDTTMIYCTVMETNVKNSHTKCA